MTESIVDAVAPSVAAPGAVSPRKVFWATWFGWMLDGFDSSMPLAGSNSLNAPTRM
ncbi:hypothetical protein [Bradyrhizobium australafricanum]|uniref:hypothetical protein n=1 Tax=Bradyrhizobium australafricanum TaxID=2821406 RepID=UPI001CE362FD|nr:hypothetical protein [Bradyrhizobium australafricanum]